MRTNPKIFSDTITFTKDKFSFNGKIKLLCCDSNQNTSETGTCRG